LEAHNVRRGVVLRLRPVAQDHGVAAVGIAVRRGIPRKSWRSGQSRRQALTALIIEYSEI